ncbi:hypothetical protein [Yinghuangia soli]|uniref:Uncharacterized protein n=1 Tax=Yinghuangia soli TaxID=2908204 RepID=A0AA41Q6B5_9ACTN|nr:hypothetical protein [Yinghuangia soli]MCF2531486.1 hypothetical protein [Yinghuangia soli]
MDHDALARQLAAVAGQLRLLVLAMDDLGVSTDSYGRQHLHLLADCLDDTARQVGALLRHPGPPSPPA